MFKKQLFVLIVILAFRPTLSTDLLLKAGTNYSWFANEGGTSEAKPAVGIGVQFPLDESQVIKLGVDVLYVGQKLILKDKSWPASSFPVDDCDLRSGNLYIYYNYLRLPLYINSTLFHKDNYSIEMDIGVDFSLSLGSKSDADYFEYDGNDCEYDYERVSGDSDPAYPIDMMVGVGFRYREIGYNLIYAYTLSKTKWLIGLKIQDQIHSIRMQLTWNFSN